MIKIQSRVSFNCNWNNFGNNHVNLKYHYFVIRVECFPISPRPVIANVVVCVCRCCARYWLPWSSARWTRTPTSTAASWGTSSATLTATPRGTSATGSFFATTWSCLSTWWRCPSTSSTTPTGFRPRLEVRPFLVPAPEPGVPCTPSGRPPTGSRSSRPPDLPAPVAVAHQEGVSSCTALVQSLLKYNCSRCYVPCKYCCCLIVTVR